MGQLLYGDVVRPGNHVKLNNYQGSMIATYLDKVGEVFDVRLKGGQPLYFVRIEGVKGAAQLRRHEFALCQYRQCRNPRERKRDE